jgi:hypothetical protein
MRKRWRFITNASADSESTNNCDAYAQPDAYYESVTYTYTSSKFRQRSNMAHE